MAALQLETIFTGQYEAFLSSIYERVNGLLNGSKFSLSTILKSVSDLESTRLIVSDGAKDRLKLKLSLNISADDLRYTLSNHPDAEISRLGERLKQ